MRNLPGETILAIASGGGRGRPLPAPQRAAMEPLIGPAVHRARVHTDAMAAAAAAELQADAFTIGENVFFGQRQYDPETPRGRALLAHELVHVRQQANRPPDRPMTFGGGGDAAEAEALAVERQVLRSESSGGLAVEHYRRHYVAADRRRLTPSDVARLDAISVRALEICKKLLGADARLGASNTIPRVQVSLRLDLGTLSDEQAAQIWGQALADTIRAMPGAA